MILYILVVCFFFKIESIKTNALLEVTQVKMKLNCEYHTDNEIREIFSELILRGISETLSLVLPFRTDCGKNISIG